MQRYKILALTTLLISGISCGGGKGDEKNHFSLEITSKKKVFHLNDTLKVKLNNPENISYSTVKYFLGDTPVEVTNNTLILNHPHLGNQTLKAVISYEDKTETVAKAVEILSNTAPKIYGYTILKEYPHDSLAYTQGLEFYNDTLYESTGLRGKSSLRKVNYKTGEVWKKIDLDPTIFGEGITILNDKIYQLTWQSKIGYVYNIHTFEKEKTFSYNESKEGWGLCHHGDIIYKSDGTEKIWTLNKESVVETGNMQLVSNKAIYSKANELEYVDGKIYANSYLNDGIMIIEAETGIILGVVDCRGLKEKITSKNKDVLNGIAYNPKTNTFFITGKNWEKMFEVTFEEK